MSEYTYDKNRPGDQTDDQSVSSADPSSQVPLTQNPASHETPAWGDDEWSLRSSSVEEDDPLIKLAKLMELNQQQEPAPVPVTVPLAPAPDEIIQSASLPTQVAADLVGETPYQAPAETYVAPEPELVMPQFSPPATTDVLASAGLSAPVLPTAAMTPEPVPASDGQIHDPFAPGGSGKIPEPTDFDVSRMPRAIRPVAVAGTSPLSGVQGQAGADLVQAAVEAQVQPAAPPAPVAPQPVQYVAPAAPQPAELPPIQAASVMPAAAAPDPFLSNPVAQAPVSPAPIVAAPPIVTPPLAAASPIAAPPIAAMPQPAAIQPAAELTAAAPASDFSYLREVEDLRVPSPAEKAAAEAAAQAELPGVVHMPNEADVDLADEDYDDIDLDDGGLFANRGMMVAAGVVAFVVLGGAALLAYQAIFTGGDNSPPPLLLASKDAVRILPDGQSADGGLTSNAGALSENGSPSDGGTLLSRSEQPVTSLNPNISGDRVARVILPNPANGTANQTRLSPTSEPLGPRPVKTFIVRPDGSIVNNSPSNTGNTGSGIKPRTVRTQVITNSGSPAAVVTNNLQLATAGPIPRVRPVSNVSNSTASTGGGSRATLPVAPRVSIGTQPVNNTSPTFNTTAPAVVKPVQPAAAPAQKPAPVQLAATTSGDFVVQVSSQRSLAAAESAYAGLKRRFPTVLASVGPDIARADLGARGIYYRVRVGPMQTRGEAAEFCNRLKNAGGDCIVARR